MIVNSENAYRCPSRGRQTRLCTLYIDLTLMSAKENEDSFQHKSIVNSYVLCCYSSYLHCKWATLKELEKDPRIHQKIKRFRTKQAQMKHLFTEVTSSSEVGSLSTCSRCFLCVASINQIRLTNTSTVKRCNAWIITTVHQRALSSYTHTFVVINYWIDVNKLYLIFFSLMRIYLTQTTLKWTECWMWL